MRAFILSCFITCMAFLGYAQSVKNVKSFYFLLGSWEMKTKSGKITETWVKHKDSLSSKSFKHKDGDSLLIEMVILKKINGNWFFCVTGFEKGNLGKTNFRLISAEDKTFVFENKENDFPTRIVYQNKDKTQLNAWIEGNINGTFRKINFDYKKR